MPHAQFFVDESKARDYILVAVKVDSWQINKVRKIIRSLQLPGQPRIHMKKESDSRKLRILSEISKLQLEIYVYVAGSRAVSESRKRAACLRGVIEDSKVHNVSRVCLERDETIVRFDKQIVIEVSRMLEFEHLVYWHDSAISEPLLSLPDAIAWAWSKGGKWAASCGNVIVKNVIAT